MLKRNCAIFIFLILVTVSSLTATITDRDPACHKSFVEHHLGLNYGLGYNFNKGLIHKFAVGYSREWVKCNSLIKDPSKNLFWLDLALGSGDFRKFGYSRVFQLEDYFYWYVPNNFDKKYKFWGKIVHATVLEAGLGRGRFKASNEKPRKTFLRLSPSLDFRFWDRLQVSPYYSMDLSLRKRRFHHEAGLKLGFHFGIRNEKSPGSWQEGIRPR